MVFGHGRVLLVWTRMILPDTSSIALDRSQGIDPAGYAGLEDGADWHWDPILAGAALSTLLGVGAELAAPERSGSDGKVIVAVRQAVQDTVNQVGHPGRPAGPCRNRSWYSGKCQAVIHNGNGKLWTPNACPHMTRSWRLPETTARCCFLD